jgi:hypothetical protein
MRRPRAPARRQVARVTVRGATGGKAEVWLGGARATTLDLYRAAEQPPDMISINDSRSLGSHASEVRVLGTKRSSSSITCVVVDAFVVLRYPDSGVHQLIPQFADRVSR